MPKEFDCPHCGDEKTVSREGAWCWNCIQNDRDFEDDYDEDYYNEDENDDEWEDEEY